MNLIKKNRERCQYLVNEENGQQIKNPFDRQFRLFWADMQKDISEQGQLRKFDPVSVMGKLFCLNAVTESTFYLANRFRYTLLVNSASVETASSETALLGMMKQMFNLGLGDAPNAPGASEGA